MNIPTPHNYDHVHTPRNYDQQYYTQICSQFMRDYVAVCDIRSLACSLYYTQRTGKLLSFLLSMPIIKAKLPQKEGYSSCCRPIMRPQKS